MLWIEDIRRRSNLGKPPISSGRSNKHGMVSFDDLIFIPSQLSRPPVDYFREKIVSETIIGKRCRNPLRLSMPIMVAGMSFGALSKESKICLAKASREAGISTNTGEGGMLPEERTEAKLLVSQYSTGRFGIDDEYYRKSDAIEIKIGQGAKPGQGGLLPKEKVTSEIVKVRKLPKQMDVHSPPSHPDINSAKDLKKTVSMIRKKKKGIPVIIKLGAGNIREDLPIALKADPDVIALDGLSGGTGAAPEIMLNDFGVPILPALITARSILDKKRAKQDLIVGGGFSKGADIAKALALGADAVFLGFPLMVSMGCIYCKKCYVGDCPVGIATQIPSKRKLFKKRLAFERTVNFLNACNEEVKMAAGATGHDNVSDLSPTDLLSMNFNTSRITGVRLVGD